MTSSASNPDLRGSRLRGWPVWGGKELRGIYCVLPEKRVSSSPSLRVSALAGAHIDPEPVHLVVSGYIDRVPKNGGGIGFPQSHRFLHDADPESADIASFDPSSHTLHLALPSLYYRAEGLEKLLRILNRMNFL